MANEFKVTQKVSYGATVGTETDTFADIFQASAAMYGNKMENLRNITIKNVGDTAVEIKLDINAWTQATPDADGAARYLFLLLAAGEHIYLPSLRLLDYDQGAASAGAAYILNNKLPADIDSGNLYQDSGFTLGANLEDTETQVTVNTAGHDFYVGDLIQVGINTTTATRIEIMEVTSEISTTVLGVKRALYGTSKADKDSQTDSNQGAVSGAKIYLPFFNIQSNNNQYNGLSTARSDASGIFHIKNFFGYGRYTGGAAGGVTMGSFSGKFYNPGMQELGLSGISANTNSGLAVSTEYKLNLTVDGGSVFENLTFTTDSSNVNFGGSNGVISKIQAALNTEFYTAGHLFEKGVDVSIVNGDIRFTSRQRLSTSAILLAAPTSGTTPFGVGRFPAIGNVNSPVAASLPNDSIYDAASGAEKTNKGVLFYDDGNGNIQGACSGTLNYNTGELRLTGCPPNADFVFSVNYGSANSGGVKLTSTGSQNGIYEISARSTNHKVDGLIEITALED